MTAVDGDSTPSRPSPEKSLPEGVTRRFEDGALRVSLPVDVYGLEAIFRSCYRLTDRCYVYLGPPSNGVIEVTLVSKSARLVDTDELTWDFLNDLVDHRHPYEEILFVYQGRTRITVGGVAYEVGPETAVFVPPDVYHSIENIGSGELRLTFTLSPPGYENVFRELARARTDHPPVPA